MAQISLFFLSKTKATELPVYTADQEGYLSEIDRLQVSEFDYNNTVCEQGLTGEIFAIDNFCNSYTAICPDILRVELKEKRTTIIEVKTLCASVRENLNRYTELSNYLEENSWSTKFFYLLSHGHERRQDWPALASINARILLWEDLFSLMKDTPIACLIGNTLRDYCEPPAQRG
jgi:hypothetical protein